MGRNASSYGDDFVNIGISSGYRLNTVSVAFAAKGYGSNAAAVGTLSAGGGSNSTALSYLAKATAKNSTAIGTNVTANKPNTVIIGNDSKVGIGTSDPKATLEINGLPTQHHNLMVFYPQDSHVRN